MKLWLLKARKNLPDGDNPWQPWYEKCFGFVVRAETEDQARQLAHNNAGQENQESFMKHPWLSQKYSQCTELLQDGNAEIVMKDLRVG